MVESEKKDPYEKILENMREYPNDIPMVDGKISEAFREYIKLMFTPEEAEIAQHLETKPLSLRTISKRINKDREETKAILEDMVDKGLIQDIGGYSYFLAIAHLLNIGFKHSKAHKRLGKRGAELYLQFFIEEKYYKRYESSDHGTPLTRTVPVEKAIDNRTEILNYEEIHRIFDNCVGPIMITDCPCRGRTEILNVRECKDKYPVEESCFQVGIFGKYFKDRNEGRELTLEEAHELVDKFAKKGLIFTTENYKDKMHQVICCCCECCCSLLRGMTRFPDKNENCTSKSRFLAKVNMDACAGCGACVKRCVFKAITIENEMSSVDESKCWGCGNCAITCPNEAIKLHRHERTPIYNNPMELMNKIYNENRTEE